MGKTAIMLRVSTEELAEIDRLAAVSGASRAGWCMAQVKRGMAPTLGAPTTAVRAAHNPVAVEDGMVKPITAQYGKVTLRGDGTVESEKPTPGLPVNLSQQPDAPRETIHKPTVEELRAKIPESTRPFYRAHHPACKCQVCQSEEKR